MSSMGPVPQATRVLPHVLSHQEARPGGPPAGTATADFVSLMRSAGQGAPPASATGSVGHAEWLAQASRRPDITAALAQLHMARRVPSSATGSAARCPPGRLANAGGPTDCNAAAGLSRESAQEILRTCAQVDEVDRDDAQCKDLLVQQEDPCGRGWVDGVSGPCVSATPALPAVWPMVWVAWPFFPAAHHPLRGPRVRSWRRRNFYAIDDELAHKDGGDGKRGQK